MTSELKELCSELSRFVVGTEGNVSQRTDKGFLIKSSGRSLREPWFVECDIDGHALPGQGTPSMEAGFHSFIYKHSNYTVIAHTHPTNTLKVLCGARIYEFASRRLFPDQVVFNGVSSCVVPYATPGEELTHAIANATAEYDPFPALLLLQSHGIVCCAHSMKEAIVMTEICEKSAEIFLGTMFANFLTQKQVLDIANHSGEAHRKSML